VPLELVLPGEPLVPAPALPDGLVLEEELRSVLVLAELRSVVELLEDEPPLGGFTLISVELDEDDGGLLAPAEELPGLDGLVVEEDDELDRSAGGVTVVEDDDDDPGRAEEPLVLFLLSPQALRAAATAVTTASLAKIRKVLSIYTLLLGN
jgi:hypothetical protein